MKYSLIDLVKNKDFNNIEDYNLYKIQFGEKDKYGNTILINYLIYNKNPSIEIIKLLENEININGNYFFTTLMSYCSNKNIENLNKEIINYFSNQIGLKDILGITSLQYYLQFNKNPTIESIELLKDEINIIDTNNNNPLMYYCKNKNIKYTNKEIINYFSKFIGLQNNYNNTSLQYYLGYNKNPSIEIIKLLKDEINMFNFYKYTPLSYYCLNENIEIINPEIINYFSNQIGLKDIYSNSILINYLHYNKNPKLENIKLLDNEKDIINNKKQTTLMYYCCNENIEQLNKKIIEYFSNQIGKKDIKENTALMYYLRYNKNPKLESIELLNEEKEIYNNKNTPLICYCINKYTYDLNIEIIKYFSNQIGLKDINNINILIYCLYNKNLSKEIIELLRK